MNSTFLKDSFSTDYKDFFSKNEIILSTPFVINWSGDIHSKYSGISIKQKIPLRLYFGLSRGINKGFRFGNLNYYDSGSDKFIQTTCYNYAPYFSYIEKYLNENYNHLLMLKGGYTINILSEASRGIGIGFNPLVTLLSSAIVNYLDKEVNFNEEAFVQDLSITINSENCFRKIILDSVKFDFLISPYPSITTKICSLAHGYYPVVGFKEDGINYQNLNNLNLFAYRFNELWTHLSKVPYSPFDFSVLYSGKPVIGEQLIASDKTYSDRSSEKHTELFEIFYSRLNKFSKKTQPKFYKNFVTADSEVVTETYGDMMGAISMEVLQKMSKIFDAGFSDDVYSAFIRAINKIRYGNMIIRKNSKEFMDFVIELLDVFGNKKEVMGIIPNDTTAMGGTLTIVSPLEVCRGMLSKTIPEMGKKYYGAALIYSNWMDGVCNEGFKIEQDLTVGLFSSVVQNSKYILIKANGVNEVGDLLELRKSSEEDVIFDLTNGKIFINGERITSDEIVSQQTTIEVLWRLKNNNRNPIFNKELSPSSFSKNKGEMINKINLPFKRLIKNRINKDIEIECVGESANFNILFNNRALNIGFINKIGS